ncbi:MAG: hypothetical protein JST43_02330 [Bacteroidetes bacterium]|nr:hypothetical protein [Bacteroidota bacterium]MBS1541187.1 hypothetical protein [Bacteroidota bacterium]
MADFIPRKIKFKAWDQEHHLLMRLNNIECSKGELIKKNHILLQFTGLHDKDGEEIYDMDVLLVSLDKYIVFWNELKNGWYFSPLSHRENQSPFISKEAERMKRFGNYFELSTENLELRKTIS